MYAHFRSAIRCEHPKSAPFKLAPLRFENCSVAPPKVDSEWLDVPGAMAYISAAEHHVRHLIKKLQAANSDDVYQPNGAGTKPLLVRRSALKDLKAS